MKAQHIMSSIDAMLYEWMSSYYGNIYTEAARLAERKRRVDLGQFVIQRDSPGGSKQFRAFENLEDVYSFIVAKPLEERTFYETIFDVHPAVKPYFDIDIHPSEDDIIKHNDLLSRLLTEIKRVVGPDLDLVNDVTVYSSHASDASKYSYHVVLTGYHVRGNTEAENFAKAVRDGLLSSSDQSAFIMSSIDLVVYKKLQQFRILGCTKLGKSRLKTVVLEYMAAGRQYRRPPVTDPKSEFMKSLLTNVDLSTSKYLDPKIYSREVEPDLNQADALLRALCSVSQRDKAWSTVSGEEQEVWFKDSGEIVQHMIEVGHLGPDLSSNFHRHKQTGDLILLRAPVAGGYHCIVCERDHEHENPYLSLHAEPGSPKSVSIIYHCRRDPMTTLRICSFHASEFTCKSDPRIGERYIKEIPASAAVDF